MVLVRYIFRRFFTYVCSTTLLLALLFTFIEFCEKIVRAKDVGIWAVMHLATLNFVPTLFDVMPLASWVATLFLIKEFYQQDEWSTITILSISPKPIIKIFFGAGLILCCIHVIAKEKIALPLMIKAEHFKRVTFKQHTPQKLINQWMALDDHTFCYCNVIDTKTYQGTGLLIITMTADFVITQTINASLFYIDPTHNIIFFPQALHFDPKTGLSSFIKETTLILPSFISQLHIAIEPPLLKNILKHLIINKKILPETVKNDLLANLFKYISTSFLLIIYPLLTLCLFFLATAHTSMQAVLLLIPYPLLLVTSTVADMLIVHGAPAVVTLIPTMGAGLFLLIYYHFLSIQEGKISRSSLKK